MEDGFNLHIEYRAGFFSVWTIMRDQEEVDFVLPILEAIRAKIAQGIEARRAETQRGSVEDESPTSHSEDAPEIGIIPVTTVKGETL